VPQCDIQRGHWCGYCSKTPHLLCSNNSDKKCEICYNKSFAAHPRAKYWSKDNDCQPWEVFKHSNKKYTFNCPDCFHKFESSLNEISSRNGWCSYCSPFTQRLCDNNECDHCYENSFASHPKANLWCDDNDTVARQTFKHSGQYIGFNCPDCNNKYVAKLSHVVSGTWCSCTKNKSETKLFDHLIGNYKYKIKKQKTFDWCVNPDTKRKLLFDFCIEDFKLIIELDGPQHFIQISNWKEVLLTQKSDIYKMKCANNNGYSVIRILQTDVWSDKNDWKNNLLKAIKKYDIPKNIFFGDCYNNHKIIDLDEEVDIVMADILDKMTTSDTNLIGKSNDEFNNKVFSRPFPRPILKSIVEFDNGSDVEFDNNDDIKYITKKVVKSKSELQQRI